MSPVKIGVALACSIIYSSPIGWAVESPKLPSKSLLQQTDFHTLRLAVTQLEDPQVRLPALRLLLPAGWKAEARFDWSNNASEPCRVSVRAYEPNGVQALLLYPSLMFADLGRSVQAREGAVVYGMEVRAMIGDARSLAENVVIARYKPELKAFRIISLEDLPELAKQAFARDELEARTSGMMPKGVRYSGARLKLEYPLNGQTVEEEIYYVRYEMPIGGSIRHWGIRAPAVFRARKGALERNMPLLRAVHASLKPTPEWLAVARQASQTLLAASRQRQSAQISQALRNAERRGQLFDALYKQYQQRDAANARIQERFIQTIRGVESYSDPLQELPVELPTGYNRAWVNERGEYVLTDKPEEPHVGSSDHWRELRKLAPGQAH